MRSTFVVIALAVAAACPVSAGEPAVRRDGPLFRVPGGAAAEPAEGWATVLSIYAGSTPDVPPVIGVYRVDGSDLVFQPRFPISPGVEVRAVYKGRAQTFAAQKIVPLPATTVVRNVYPTATTVPANQLKFYVEFSQPMRHGEAWDHLRLLDDAGKTVELAFLELDQELWDRDGRRLTILFDPGRIKRGVLPRDEIGASLQPGKEYTFVVDQRWRDARGATLAAEYRKAFRVSEEDRTAINEKSWQITPPAVGTRNALIVAFGESLDSALALRLITVSGVSGTATLAKEEREWHFVPDAPWSAGEYRIAVDTALEDLAGNRVGRAFDVDTFERVTVRVNRGSVFLPFRISGQ